MVLDSPFNWREHAKHRETPIKEFLNIAANLVEAQKADIQELLGNLGAVEHCTSLEQAKRYARRGPIQQIIRENDREVSGRIFKEPNP